MTRLLVPALTDATRSLLLEDDYLEPPTALEHDEETGQLALSILPGLLTQSFEQRCLGLAIASTAHGCAVPALQLVEHCLETRMTDLDVLVAKGLFSGQLNEFGEQVVELMPGVLETHWERSCQRVVPFVTAPVDFELASKLDLVLQLFRAGWIHVDRTRLGRYVRHGEKKFPSTMHGRSNEHFVALCRSEDLFEAGWMGFIIACRRVIISVLMCSKIKIRSKAGLI